MTFINGEKVLKVNNILLIKIYEGFIFDMDGTIHKQHP